MPHNFNYSREKINVQNSDLIKNNKKKSQDILEKTVPSFNK